MIDFGFGVHLRALNENSFVNEWRNNPKIWRWTRQNDLILHASQKDWFERIAKDQSIKMYGIWADAMVGVCGLTSINWQNRNAEFSLYIAPTFQKTGLSKPSLKTLFFHGFQNMGLRSIWGETFENNHAQYIFEAIGMRRDGLRRQFYWKDGRHWDAILYSVLNDEWFERHGVRSCFG